MRHMLIPFVVALSLTLSAPVAAYVGPGAGLSLLGALWALVVAIGAALVFLVAWPLRRMHRRRRERDETPATPAEAVSAEMAPASPTDPEPARNR